MIARRIKSALLAAIAFVGLAVQPALAQVDTTARGMAAQRAPLTDPGLGVAPILGALGNSWVAQGVSGNNLLARGFPNYVAARLKGRVRISSATMLGYSGQTSTVIKTHVPEIIAAGAKYVLVEGLINNYTGGASYSQSVTDIDEITAALNAGGAVPIFGTIPPRSDVNNSAALRGFNQRLNDYLFSKMAASKRGTMYVADVASALTSRSDSAGAQIAGVYNVDNVHPVDYGAWVTSQAYFDVLDSVIPQMTPYTVWRTSTFSRTDNPTGWAGGNPSLFGSSGTITSGGSGSLANSLTLIRVTGSVFQATASKLTGLNGGEFQRFVLGASGLGAATEQIELSFTVALEAGDVVQPIADISTSGMTNVNAIYIQLNGSATGTYRGLNNSAGSADLVPASSDLMPRTTPITIAANETVTVKLAIVGKTDVAAPTGTIDIKVFGLKVIRPHS